MVERRAVRSARRRRTAQAAEDDQGRKAPKGTYTPVMELGASRDK